METMLNFATSEEWANFRNDFWDRDYLEFAPNNNYMKNKKKVRILTLDGGGIRGIIPATII